jgi:hypothetical protein
LRPLQRPDLYEVLETPLGREMMVLPGIVNCQKSAVVTLIKDKKDEDNK